MADRFSLEGPGDLMRNFNASRYGPAGIRMLVCRECGGAGAMELPEAA